MSDTLCERISEYLANGGLWNPESMDHKKVSSLLIECRDTLQDTAAREQAARLEGMEDSASLLVERCVEMMGGICCSHCDYAAVAIRKRVAALRAGEPKAQGQA